MLPTKENFYPFHINMKTEEIMEKEEKRLEMILHLNYSTNWRATWQVEL